MHFLFFVTCRLRNLCDVIFNLCDLFFNHHTSTLQALKDNDPAYDLQLVARLRLSIRSQGEWSIDCTCSLKFNYVQL